MNTKTNPLTWLAVALVIAIALMVALGSWAMSTYGGYTGMMSSGSWGWATLMMGAPAIILIVILFAALSGLREPTDVPAYGSATQQPLEILERRYARGELTREDYLKIRDDLTRGPSHS